MCSARDQIVMAVLRLVVDRRAPLHDLLQARRRRTSRPARAARQTSSASVSAARPSPSAMRMSDSARLGIERQLLAFDRLGAGRAASRSPSASSDLNTSTRARDSSGAISSNDGFSVVAPTSTMVPSSITGRKQSCCARLKRWISSTNSSVPCPVSRRARAASNTFFRSATPEKIAEICSKCRLGRLRQQPRHRGLAGAGRPPEDQRAERARLEHARQRAVRAEQMVLADHLGELLRAQLVGERPRRVAVEAGGREQARPLGFGPGVIGTRPSSCPDS